jgi:uncharacterized protein
LPEADHRFLPRRAPIDAYGAGGFRFADMSHRGSLLILPSGMHAWGVTTASALEEGDLRLMFEEAAEIELALIGTGQEIIPLPEALRWRFRDLRIGVEVMPTAAAARTWNVLLAEDRQVAAALVAVD